MLGIYLIIGAFAGLVSGLFGIGGGTIIVPALAALFYQSNLVPSTEIMHMAIGTSLATVIFTSLSGGYAHYKRGVVDWKAVKPILPTLLIGVILGAVIAGELPSRVLKIIFGSFLLIIAIRLFSTSNRELIKHSFSKKIAVILSFFIGLLTSMLGTGGGILIVPLLLRLKLKMHNAVGTSLVCAFFISLVGTLCYSIAGYIYWPAFLGITLASILFAPIGTLIAHKIQTKLLKQVFSAYLFLIALDMLIFAR